MTTIGLIRHGVTDWNVQRRAQGQTDIPLNQDGLNQAQALARRLLGEQWDMVVSSDLSRAYVTGKTVANLLQIPIIKDTRLREMYFGEVEGLTKEERIEKWGPQWKQFDHGGETNEEARSRSVDCVEEVCLQHPNKRILFISHGATLNQLMIGLMKDETFDVSFSNTSISVLQKQADKWSLQVLNCAKHLGEGVR
ncbi:histidine phosphatase family protein [Salirhabdus salicampi]|uniref:histidine phosphatase family protein n=1 Tax=Salirhabdus salicampi TaxID=476102 RepID=UPI0020C40F07|nr:histidine phosphatase family protein [Salirhabdus salicampi]MCP8615975.1 histidine phosphatase family protein [Salirhabdus salicampi]